MERSDEVGEGLSELSPDVIATHQFASDVETNLTGQEHETTRVGDRDVAVLARWRVHTVRVRIVDRLQPPCCIPSRSVRLAAKPREELGDSFSVVGESPPLGHLSILDVHDLGRPV